MSRFTVLLFILFLMVGCTVKDKPVPQKTSSPPKISYYENETVRYKVPITKDWTLKPPKENADMFIVSNDGSLSPDPSINIQSVETEKYDLWDKKSQAKIIAEIDPKLKPAEQNNKTINGERAYNLIYGFEKDGRSVIIDQTYLFHNGYFIVITCSCREEEYNRFKEVFGKLINSIDFYK